MASMHINSYSLICKWTHRHRYTQIQADRHTYTNTDTDTHMHARMDARTHIYAHTHTTVMASVYIKNFKRDPESLLQQVTKILLFSVTSQKFINSLLNKLNKFAKVYYTYFCSELTKVFSLYSNTELH